jgi:acetyltransferase-like isoleucine patch superfamily enzyme
VRIEKGCWIGEKVIILPGVNIGKRSIIGAGSVVTKSIPEYSIAVGNPARVIKTWNKDKKQWVKENE